MACALVQLQSCGRTLPEPRAVPLSPTRAPTPPSPPSQRRASHGLSTPPRGRACRTAACVRRMRAARRARAGTGSRARATTTVAALSWAAQQPQLWTRLMWQRAHGAVVAACAAVVRSLGQRNRMRALLPSSLHPRPCPSHRCAASQLHARHCCCAATAPSLSRHCPRLHLKPARTRPRPPPTRRAARSSTSSSTATWRRTAAAAARATFAATSPRARRESLLLTARRRSRRLRHKAPERGAREGAAPARAARFRGRPPRRPQLPRHRGRCQRRPPHSLSRSSCRRRRPSPDSAAAQRAHPAAWHLRRSRPQPRASLRSLTRTR